MADEEARRRSPSQVSEYSKVATELLQGHNHPADKKSRLSDTKERTSTILFKIFQPQSNQRSRRLYRSHASILKEKNRQKETNQYIIHPFSSFRWCWDVILVVVLIFALMVQPVEIAFFSSYENVIDPLTNVTFQVIVTKHAQKWKAVNAFIDTIFLIDVLINFRTAFIDPITEQVIFENKAIAMNYLKGWFFIDIISSVPFDLIYEAIASSNKQASFAFTLRVLRFVKMLSLLKGLRVVRLMRYISSLEDFLHVEANLINIFHLVIVTVVFLHWNACVQFLLPFMQDFPESSWTVEYGLEGQSVSIWYRYSFSLYRSIGQMLGMGYSLYAPPTNFSEMWLALFSYMFGSIFYALLVAHLANLIQSLNLPGKKYEEKIAEVKEYMRFRKIPADLQEKMLQFYDHMYQRKFFDEAGILYDPHMSPNLRQEILLYNCRSLVTKVPFLKDSPQDFIVDIVSKLHYQVYFPDDVIVRAGTIGKSMYFIDHGAVEIRLPDGQPLVELCDGDYFGEIALLMDQRRLASVIALEVCDLYELHKDDFIDVLSNHPQVRSRLVKEATKRLEQCHEMDYVPGRGMSMEALKAVTVQELGDRLVLDHDKRRKSSVGIPMRIHRPSLTPSIAVGLMEKEEEEK